MSRWSSTGCPKKATQSETPPISTVFELTTKSLHPMVEETWEIGLNGKLIVKTKLFCTEKIIGIQSRIIDQRDFIKEFEARETILKWVTKFRSQGTHHTPRPVYSPCTHVFANQVYLYSLSAIYCCTCHSSQHTVKFLFISFVVSRRVVCILV